MKNGVGRSFCRERRTKKPAQNSDPAWRQCVWQRLAPKKIAPVITSRNFLKNPCERSEHFPLNFVHGNETCEAGTRTIPQRHFSRNGNFRHKNRRHDNAVLRPREARFAKCQKASRQDFLAGTQFRAVPACRAL